MYRFKQLGLAALSALAIAGASAGEPVAPALVENITEKLAMPERGFVVERVAASPVSGLYEVQYANGGPTVYSSADGDFVLDGSLYAVESGNFVKVPTVAEQQAEKVREEVIASVDAQDMIVFSPEGEPRSYISVFTDVDCVYCQKFHREVPVLVEKGIEVRYLAFPRAGLGSASYRKLASAWCADDPRDTLTRLKAREAVPESVCEPNPIAGQMQMAGQLGVRGTPAIITPTGQLIPGALPADELVSILGLESSPGHPPRSR